MRRRYRVRVADAGATSVDGNVDFTLDLGDLTVPPVVTGQITHPVQGRTEMRPFRVHARFPDATIAELVTSDRWTAVGRLVDVAYQDADDDPNTDPWTIYGSGRISMMGEPDGRGRVDLEVSTEAWKARQNAIFEPDSAALSTTQNTTQLWPSGVKQRWRGIPAATKADGELIISFGDFHLIRARSAKALEREITDKLDDWVREDVVADPVTRSDGNESDGNFQHLRLNYAGTDYEIASFGPSVRTEDFGVAGAEILLTQTGDLIPDKLGQVVANEDEFFAREVTLRVWVLSDSTPPATGDAYLHAPSARPSKELPLHLGLDWAAHRWGSSGGWAHMGDLTQTFWDVAGIDYDSTALTAIQGDTSIPSMAMVVRDEIDDEWAWFEKNAWSPNRHIVLRNSDGLPKIVDMRLPQDVDPDTLLELDASNTNAMTWQLLGREVVTQIRYKFLTARKPLIGVDEKPTALDGLIYNEGKSRPFQADSQAITASGIRNLDIELGHVLEPVTDNQRQAGILEDGIGGLFGQVAEELANDVFDIFRDGAWRSSIEVSGDETIEEGDPVVVDAASLKLANPATQSRTGNRIMRVISLERHPAHYVAQLIDLGPKLAPLATPSVTMEQARDPDALVVTLADTPAGAEVTLEVTYSASSSTPSAWVLRRSGLGDGAHTFLDPPKTGYAHARVRARTAGRIRSPWQDATPLRLLPDPAIADFRVEIDEDGVPTVYGTPNASTEGVRLRYVIHDAGTDPSFPSVS